MKSEGAIQTFWLKKCGRKLRLLLVCNGLLIRISLLLVLPVKKWANSYSPMPKIIIFATKSIKMKQKLSVFLLFALFLVLNVSISFSNCGIWKKHKSPTLHNERALIWKIEGNGLAKPSYIMGTMHTQCPEIVDHIEGWEEASTQCEMLVSELTYEEYIWITDSIGRMTARALNKFIRDSTLLQRYTIDPSRWTEVYTKHQIESIKDVDSTLLSYQPHVAIQNIKNSIEAAAKREQLYPALYQVTPTLVPSLDYSLVYAFHHEKGLPNVSLDDSLFRMNYVDKIENAYASIFDSTESDKFQFKDQAELFYKYIECKNDILNKLKALDTLYYYHDLYRTETALKQCALAYPDYDANKYNLEDSLTYATRNEKWMQKIPQYMEEKSCLIMVGFGHLVKTQNDRGLIQRLREMNYTLTPFIYNDGNE